MCYLIFFFLNDRASTEFNTLPHHDVLPFGKFSNRDRLLGEWEANMLSLVAFVEQAQRGLRGTVSDLSGGRIAEAQIQVQKLDEEQSWRGKNVTSWQDGRYWRILLPGNYRVRAVKGNRSSQVTDVTIAEDTLFTKLDLVIED